MKLTLALTIILLTAGCAGNTSSTGNSTASTHESNFILTDEGRIHVKTQVDTLTLTLIFDSGGASLPIATRTFSPAATA